MKTDKPAVPGEHEGYFSEARDKTKLFIYDYQPAVKYKSTIFIISGITGINHHAEGDLIGLLSKNGNRVVVIHPRGTGFSGGVRGDISDFSDFITDYIEIITADRDYDSPWHRLLLFGHSMSTAILLVIADKIKNVGGAILINPPFTLKRAKGMSPGLTEFMRYAWFYLFNRHKPVVNMAGDPEKIEDIEDRKESESRMNDPLLVNHFSLHMMMEIKKIMNSMACYADYAFYPLLLIYGERDRIVERKGCETIYNAWNHPDKEFVIVKNGSHGQSTIKHAGEKISEWISNR